MEREELVQQLPTSVAVQRSPELKGGGSKKQYLGSICVPAAFKCAVVFLQPGNMDSACRLAGGLTSKQQPVTRTLGQQQRTAKQ